MIEFRNVSKVYNNGTEALHNINLKVEKGEFVFIVGSSGAGKVGTLLCLGMPITAILCYRVVKASILPAYTVVEKREM